MRGGAEAQPIPSAMTHANVISAGLRRPLPRGALRAGETRFSCVTDVELDCHGGGSLAALPGRARRRFSGVRFPPMPRRNFYRATAAHATPGASRARAARRFEAWTHRQGAQCQRPHAKPSGEMAAGGQSSNGFGSSGSSIVQPSPSGSVVFMWTYAACPSRYSTVCPPTSP